MNNILQVKKADIVEVYRHNFQQEIGNIAETMARGFGKVVSFDTEFPGLSIKTAKPTTDSQTEYKNMKDNVNAQKMIQFGMTLSDAQGNLPPQFTYQFNIEFDLAQEQHDPAAIALLYKSGIEFEQLKSRGIPIVEFAEQLLSLNMVLNEETLWVCFHGNYDLAYLMKSLLNEHLPDTMQEFHHFVQLYFPRIVDLKYLLRDNEQFRAIGLAALASRLNLPRIGTQHQAGSDSLLTHACYFKLSPDRNVDHNVIYGLADGFVQYYHLTYQNSLLDPSIQYQNSPINYPVYMNSPSYDQQYEYMQQQNMQQSLQQFQEYMQTQYTNKIKLKKKMKR